MINKKTLFGVAILICLTVGVLNIYNVNKTVIQQKIYYEEQIKMQDKEIDKLIIKLENISQQLEQTKEELEIQILINKENEKRLKELNEYKDISTYHDTSIERNTNIDEGYYRTVRVSHYTVNDLYTPSDITATGDTLVEGMCAFNGVPFGTKIYVNGAEYSVMDRCGFDNCVDIYVDTYEEAINKGVYEANVLIVEE